MANAKHVQIAQQGTLAIESWIREHPNEILDLKSANLAKVNLSNADMRKWKLRWANLEKADLCGADLRGARIGPYPNAEEEKPRPAVNLEWADLSESNLRHCDLRNVILCTDDFEGTDLSTADLRGSSMIGLFLGTKFSLADLRNTNLRESNFTNCDFRGADMRDASCPYTSFNGADLTGANFSRADLRGAMFSEFFGHIPAKVAKVNFREALFSTTEDEELFLELACAEGLESAEFSSPDFLSSYIAKALAFSYSRSWSGLLTYTRPVEDFVEVAIKRIRLIQPLFIERSLPPKIYTEIHLITSQLLDHLKTNPSDLYRLSSRQFEELVAEVLAANGCQVMLTPTTRDGGYDIFAVSKSIEGVEHSWIVECKRYTPDRKVGVAVVRALYGLKLDLRADSALLATTSVFSRDAQQYSASRYDLTLKDYAAIVEWLNAYKPSPCGRLFIKDNKLIIPGETKSASR